jgi:hypothetical protein
LAVEIGSDRPHTILISAGVHGDEPAAPWALYALVRDGLLDDRFGYRLWPCTNPSGYAAGTRRSAEGTDINRSFSRGGTAPESRAILTANRDRKFALSLDLHEDLEADGFYVFEPLAPGAEPRYGAEAVRSVEDAGFPIQDLSDLAFDLGTPPEARAIQRIGHGTVVVDARAESRYFEGGLTFSLAMLRGAAAAGLTLESPQRRAWDARIAMHRVAVTAVLARAGNALAEAN